MPNLDLRPPALNLLTYYKGDYTIRFEFTQDASVYPLTDVTAASFIIYEKNGTPALSLSSGSGLTINGAGGYIDLALTNAQVVALYSQEYNFEFILTLTGGDVWPIADGVFIVSEDGQTSVTLTDITLSLENSTVEISVIAPPSGGGGGTWGSITGTLSDQTDLQAALDGKVDENAAIAGATKTKITYDAKGLVTSGADAGIADITGLQAALDGKAASSHTHPFSQITSGTFPALETSATIPSDGAFDVKYNGGITAFEALDTGGTAKIQSKSGAASIEVGPSGATIIGDPFVSIESDGSSGAAGYVLTAVGNGTATWQPGGGGASYTEITYADMQTAITNGTLTPGGWYLITDAAGTDLGFLTHAVTENSISVAGVGGYLNADFQAVGDYSGVDAITGVAAETQQGIWRTGFEALTINYTNQSGGTFAAGDTITGATTGAEATVVNDDGAGAVIAYMTSAGVAFDGSEVLDNGNGVTADMTGIELPPTLALGDIVIWNLLHWQLTDDTVLDGTDPETNTLAYTQLLKTDADQGYITAWDESEYDFGNDTIIYRQDLRGNLVRGNTGVVGFQWGRDAHAGNNIQSPSTFDTKNLVAAFNNNTTYPGADVSDIVTGVDTLIENNILENGAQLTGIAAGENCSISRNKVGQGAILGGSTTMGDGAEMNDLEIRANKSIANKELDAGVTFSDKVIQVTADEAETLSDNVDGNRSQPGYSDIPATIDIAGLTTLDCTAAFAQYRGIYNITSSNATEAIDQIDNPPTQFPFLLRPAAGLVLTITGTAYAGIAAGQIALKAASYVLDGDKGEYIVLEIDPLGTGALIEKQVVNGLI